MKKNIVFITGIDTNCGKTFVTGNLGKKLKTQGFNIITHKLAQTGCIGISEDITAHRKWMNMELCSEDLSGETCPYVFQFPASPHLAALKENRTIEENQLITSLENISNKYDIVLCEGAGGLFVPLNEKMRIIDFIQKHNFPLILVTSSKLGSINHTYLSLEACFNRKLPLKTIVYNTFPEDHPEITQDSFRIIKNGIKQFYPDCTVLSSEQIAEHHFQLENLL